MGDKKIGPVGYISENILFAATEFQECLCFFLGLKFRDDMLANYHMVYASLLYFGEVD
jgi:hypothetical protein